jgi:hypothetical protein
MKIYTYCIIDAHDRIRDEAMLGLEGARIYTLSYLDIGIVVSEFEQQTRYTNEDNILEHERVVENLMEYFTVLPMRFFTVFDRKEDVFHMLKDYYPDFKKNLKRLRNKVEFGVKVIWPGDKVREKIASAYTGQCELPIANNSQGAKFIREKFKEYKIDKKYEEEANKQIEVIDKFFCEFASEKKLEKHLNKNLLLNAYYLIDKEKQSTFKEGFQRLKGAASGFNYLFSGPWPPYNFIILNKKPYSLKA